jgi:hypothetical protein
VPSVADARSAVPWSWSRQSVQVDVEQLTCRSGKVVSRGVLHLSEDRGTQPKPVPTPGGETVSGAEKPITRAIHERIRSIILIQTAQSIYISTDLSDLRQRLEPRRKVCTVCEVSREGCCKPGCHCRTGAVNETSTTKHLPFGAESLSWRVDQPALERGNLSRVSLIGLSGGAPLNGIL